MKSQCHNGMELTLSSSVSFCIKTPPKILYNLALYNRVLGFLLMFQGEVIFG